MTAPSVVQQLEDAIAEFVTQAQARVFAAAERLVREHLEPVDAREAELFLAELQRGDV